MTIGPKYLTLNFLSSLVSSAESRTSLLVFTTEHVVQVSSSETFGTLKSRLLQCDQKRRVGSLPASLSLLEDADMF